MVFANFNLALKDDVMLHLYEETLRGVRNRIITVLECDIKHSRERYSLQVTAFAHLDPSFFRILSSRLKEAYFQTGASVFKQGDIISNIYIIHQGEVTLVGDLEEQTAILWRSMYIIYKPPTDDVLYNLTDF